MDSIEETGSKLSQLAKEFRENAEPFRLRGVEPRAQLFYEPARERWGIWQLKPPDAAWNSFALLAARAIMEVGIPPMPAPQPEEYDPAWRKRMIDREKKLRRRDTRLRQQVDYSRVKPYGLDSVDSCTRAWLHFLRPATITHETLYTEREYARLTGIKMKDLRKQQLMKVDDSGGVFVFTAPDVWEASALRLEQLARERIEKHLLIAAPRRGYRNEVRKWMKDKQLKTIRQAAERLDIGYDLLKNIMTSKGKKRYGDETLNDVLRKIEQSKR